MKSITTTAPRYNPRASNRTPNTLAEAAADLTACGLAVFPVLIRPNPKEPGRYVKQPLLSVWQERAARTHAEAVGMLGFR